MADLQAEIRALADFPVKPESDWVMRVQNSPTEVIAGAILTWVTISGISMVPGDPMAPRREAAQAILQARFSADLSAAVSRLQTTIDIYQTESATQTSTMVWLTRAIALLTVLMLVGLVVQIGMAWSAAHASSDPHELTGNALSQVPRQ